MTSVHIARWRVFCVVATMLTLAVLLIWRVASLQVLPDADEGFKFLQNAGNARTQRTRLISAYRGVITDRNGEPLAVSTPVESLWVNPKVLIQSPERWATLSQMLGWDKENLEARLARFSEKEFMYLKRHMPPQEAAKITALNIPGVHTQREYQRFYPAGEVAAHIVGITDIDDRGQEGMELAYDAWLAGEDGAKRVIKDLHGRVVKEVGLLKAAKGGRDLALSIDLRLQNLAYKELKKAVRDFDAKAGSIVILDVTTGEVLAMVNQPSYNPNDRATLKSLNLRNRALTDVFEPGSPMKPLAVMAALESGKFHAHSIIDTNPGYVRVGKKTLLDPRNYGLIDLTRIVVKSSQVGMTKLALEIEPDAIRDMYYRLGLGQGTGTGFPGEAVGVLPSYTNWKPIQRATYAFGYGLNLTVLQLAQAYSVVASNGIKRPVSLLRTDDVPPGEQVVAKRHTQDVMRMLQKVVGREGTATRAKIDAYPVAGKTGTVHKAENGGYSENKYIGSFVGIAPANKPRIVAVVMIDEPSDTRYFGGQVAAPVFASVAEGALRLLREPPQNQEEKVIVQTPVEAQKIAGPVSW